MTELTRKIERLRDGGWKKLPAKSRLFAHEYVLCYDPVVAGKKAKIKEPIKLLRDPLVAAYICELQEDLSYSNFITEDFIRTQYLAILPMLSGQEGVPMVDKDGNEYTAKKFFATELLSLLRDMRKMTPDYQGEKLDVTASFPEAFRQIMKNI